MEIRAWTPQAISTDKRDFSLWCGLFMPPATANNAPSTATSIGRGPLGATWGVRGQRNRTSVPVVHGNLLCYPTPSVTNASSKHHRYLYFYFILRSSIPSSHWTCFSPVFPALLFLSFPTTDSEQTHSTLPTFLKLHPTLISFELGLWKHLEKQCIWHNTGFIWS